MSDDNKYEHHDAELLSRVAWYYYHDGMTQSEIGTILNLSRIKISRISTPAMAAVSSLKAACNSCSGCRKHGSFLPTIASTPSSVSPKRPVSI
jgi:hypothetical protein